MAVRCRKFVDELGGEGEEARSTFYFQVIHPGMPMERATTT